MVLDLFKMIYNAKYSLDRLNEIEDYLIKEGLWEE